MSKKKWIAICILLLLGFSAPAFTSDGFETKSQQMGSFAALSAQDSNDDGNVSDHDDGNASDHDDGNANDHDDGNANDHDGGGGNDHDGGSGK